MRRIQGQNFDSWIVRLQPIHHLSSAFFRRGMTDNKEIIILDRLQKNFGRFIAQYGDEAEAVTSEQIGPLKGRFFVVGNLKNALDRLLCRRDIPLRDNLVGYFVRGNTLVRGACRKVFQSYLGKFQASDDGSPYGRTIWQNFKNFVR